MFWYEHGTSLLSRISTAVANLLIWATIVAVISVLLRVWHDSHPGLARGGTATRAPATRDGRDESTKPDRRTAIRPTTEVSAMRAVKEWKVTVMIGENDGRTYAEARLVTEIGDRLVGVGRAYLAPTDYDVPEIGDEVAVARALRALADNLLDTASGDISQMTAEDVHLSR